MKIIREVYLYSDTHLPTHGWLQGCWECETITSRIITYKTVLKGKLTYKFIVYLCPHCKKTNQQIKKKRKNLIQNAMNL